MRFTKNLGRLKSSQSVIARSEASKLVSTTKQSQKRDCLGLSGLAMTHKGQAVVEYILTFAVLVAGFYMLTIKVFGNNPFNPDEIGFRETFQQSVNNALVEINNEN